MKIYFSHGKESGPWGTKIKRLADLAEQHGYQVESIDYRDSLDPDLRAKRLSQILQQEVQNVLLVGSSMGGYVSLLASENSVVQGLFLLAPALFIEGYGVQEHSCSKILEIVHGWSDEVIPVENSIKYAKGADCSLHLISGDHRLNSSLEEVERLFSNFLLNHKKSLT